MDRQTGSQFIYDGADKWLILPVALLAALAVLLFVPLELGVNVPLYILAFYIVVFAYQGRGRNLAERDSIYFLLIVMVALLPFILYDTSPFRIIQFIMLGFFVLFQVFTMYGCRRYAKFHSESWLYDAVNAVILMPLFNLDAPWKVLREAGKTRIIFTALIAFIVSPGLVILLTGAQGRGFGRCAAAYIGGAALFAVLFFYSFAFLYGCRRKRNADILKKPEPCKLRRVPAWISIALLSALCVGCLAYIVSQSLYFISLGSGRIPAEDLSSYARRGFMELCGMVLLNLAAISFAAVFTRTESKDEKKKRAVLWLIVALCALSILLIAAAFVKMLLYMRSYGLTTNRLITSFFMFGLLIVCVIIIVRAFRPKLRPVRAISFAAVALFLVLCFADCDYLALSYNRNAYISGQLQGFDIDMLYGCSDSIVPIMIDVYENSTGQLKAEALHFLDRYNSDYELSPARIRSFNIASYNARNKYLQWKK